MNGVGARLVAAGVVALSVVGLATGHCWLLVPLAYGFVAVPGPSASPTCSSGC